MHRGDCSLLAVYERDMRTCWLCGLHVGYGPDVFFTPLAPSRDHVIPLRDNGPTHPSNLRLAHAFCNSAREVYEPAHLTVIVRAMMRGVDKRTARARAPMRWREKIEPRDDSRSAPAPRKSRSWSEIMADNRRIRKARKAAGAASFTHPVRPAMSAPMYGVKGDFP